MKQKKIKKIILGILLFLIFFIMLSAFKNLSNFCDESDNFLGGIILARGGKIYDSFVSQHTPLMYFISSLFSRLGVFSIEKLRLCFYGLMSLIWVGIIFRYFIPKKKILIFFPFIYIAMMSVVLRGYSIISEQLQAQFLLILFLEMFLFYEKKKISLSSMIIISLSIFGSIGVAFVSIIPVFGFIIGMLAIDVNNYCKKKKFSLKKYLNLFWKKYKKFLLICIVPFIIFILYLTLTGTLKAFYEQAIYLNTKIYSKYNTYSSNPFKSMAMSIINYLPVLIKSCIKLFKSFNLINLNLFIFYLFTLVYFAIFLKKDKLLAILGLIFVLFCANRTFYDFHAIPYYAVSIFAGLLALSELKISFYKKTAIIYVITIVILLPYFINNFKSIFSPIKDLTGYHYVSTLLLNEGDTMWLNNLDVSQYIITGHYPSSSVYTLVPWFVEMYGERTLSELKNNNPKIIRYNPKDNIWGYIYEKFSPSIDQYIKNNYTYFNNIDYWIRNDYIEEANKRLNNNN